MRADVAIISTRADEFEAVLKRFSPNKPQRGSSGRTYGICQVRTRNEKDCTVVLVRCGKQGSDASQQVTNDIIRDLDPYILLVVGITGGVPDDEFTLGDVIISSRIHNFNASALQAGNRSEFDVRGGIHPLCGGYL
jgi:nucleoside phosphorylase